MYARAWSKTDVGMRREKNEDCVLTDPDLGLYVVADGMGGHASGEVASALAVEGFHQAVIHSRDAIDAFREGITGIDPALIRRILEDAMAAACRRVYERALAEPDKRGMGTTLSALLLVGTRGFVAHVGDSRVYLVRERRPIQLTRDHSVLNELVKRGELSAADAATPEFAGFRNALARAVGVTSEVEVDVLDFEVLPSDVFVLGSDGLTHYIPDRELPRIVAELLPESICEHMVALANERGGHDNITAVVVRVESEETSDLTPGVDRNDEFLRKVDAFKRIPLFHHLDYSQLLRVLSATRTVWVRRGELVLHEGRPGDALYVVLSGRVRLARGGVPLAELGPGSHFGELSLIDQAPRSATALMLEDGRLLHLEREELHLLVRREPEIAVKLLWSFAETFSERLRRTTDQLLAERARNAERGDDRPVEGVPDYVAGPARGGDA